MATWLHILVVLSMSVCQVHSLYYVYLQVSTTQSTGSFVVNYMVITGSLGASPQTNINTNNQGVLNSTILADGNLAVITDKFPADYGPVYTVAIGNNGDSLSLTSFAIYDVMRTLWSNKTFTGSDGYIPLNSSKVYSFVVNGSWNTWSGWTSCSQTCAGGSQTRQRQCNNPTPLNGGTLCSGESSQSALCNSFACPIDGAWALWSNWSACSITCGSGGTQTRSRDCNPPSNGGMPCKGTSAETIDCIGLPGCPVDGQWSSWTSWTSCSVTCGQTGALTRNRNCDNPKPIFGGKTCDGSFTETTNCSGIPKNCPVNGGWGTWTKWTTCSATCGTGSQTRMRFCDSPTPKYEGSLCSNCSTMVNGSCGSFDQVSANCTLPTCISMVDYTNNVLTDALSSLNRTGNTTLSDKATMKIAFAVVDKVKNALMNQLSNRTAPVMVDTKAVTVGLANLNPNSTAPANITSKGKGGISMDSTNNITSTVIVQFSALQSSTFFKSATVAQSSAPILSLGISDLPPTAAIPITLSMPNQNGQTVDSVMVPLTFLQNGILVQTLNYDSDKTVFQLSLNLKNVTNFTIWFSMKGILPNVSSDADAAVSVLTLDGSKNMINTNLNLVVDFSNNPLLGITIPSGQMSANTQLLIEMFTLASNNTNDTVTIQLGVASITPRQWNYDMEVWQDSDAQVGDDSDISNVNFKSNFLGTFSAKIFIPPNLINFKNVFSNFTQLLSKSFVVLIVLIVLIILYVLLGIMMWRKDRREALLLRYEPLLDNDPEHEYTYIVNIYTSACRDAGTSSGVFVNVLGKWGTSSHRKVEDGYRENLFSTGSVCRFVMTTESSLGELLALRVWHNSSGPQPAWHLEKILIEDMQTKKMYIFMCDSWMAEEKFDGKTERVLLEIKRDQKFQEMFYRIKIGGAMDKHVMLTLTKNTGLSNYTRLQKLSVFVAMFFLIMVSNAMFFGKDAALPAEANFTLNLGIISMTWFQIYTGMISVLITYPCIFLASEIFRRTKRWNRRWTEDEETAMKKELRLPKGFVFIGWMLLFVAIAAAAFFTFLYSLEWGNDKSNDWLQSFFLGIVGMVVFTDPIILLIIYILATKLFGAVSQDRELNIDAFINDDIKRMIGANLTEPDKEKLEQIKKDKENAQRLSSTIQDGLTYCMYVFLLIALAYDARDGDIYQQNTILKSVFTKNAQSNIKTYNDVYSWAYSMLDQVYPSALYNSSKRIGDLKNSIRICDCMRQGPFRLRQVRVKKNTCVASSFINQAYGNVPCNENFNLLVKEYGYYRANWSDKSSPKVSFNDTNWNKTYLSPTQAVIDAYRYQNETESGGYPFEGRFGVYEGGGYVGVLGMSRSQAEYVIRNLNKTQWLDKLSRGVFFEGTVYNWNTNLFSTIQILFETPNSGGTYVYPFGIRSYRLYDYTPGKMIVLLSMQVLYLLIVAITIYREIKKIIKLRGKYLSDSWNQLEILTIILAICIIITTAIRIMLTINATTKLNTSKGSYVAFDNVAMWVETTCLLMAVSCFFSILRMLKYLGFNKYVAIMQCTLVRAWEQFSSFAFALLFFLMAYVTSGHIMFSVTNVLFSDILKMLRTLFGAFLGMVNLTAMFETTPATDSMLYYFSWCTLAMIFLMSIFICILNDTYSEILAKDLYEYDKELVDHMWNKFNQLMNSFTSSVKSSVPNILTKKTLVAPVDMDDVDIMMGSRESVRQFSKLRLNPSVRRKLAELNNEKFSDINSTKRNHGTGNEIYINPISFTDINLTANDSQLFSDETFMDRVPRFRARGNPSALGNNPASVLQPTRPMMRPTQTLDYLPQIKTRQRRASRNKTFVLKDNPKSNSHI